MAYLNQVLAFGLGNEWLQLGSGECVDQTSLGHDEEQDLGSGEDGKFVGLSSAVGVSKRTRRGSRFSTARQTEKQHRIIAMPSMNFRHRQQKQRKRTVWEEQ